MTTPDPEIFEEDFSELARQIEILAGLDERLKRENAKLRRAVEIHPLPKRVGASAADRKIVKPVPQE